MEGQWFLGSHYKILIENHEPRIDQTNSLRFQTSNILFVAFCSFFLAKMVSSLAFYRMERSLLTHQSSPLISNTDAKSPVMISGHAAPN
ncbi:hypothetical protein NPIL_76611 [Nephila pilipes]|uniref:Uncharacterized protein n=1 Tax=Nephila pilipes TaxID=299642 RepID=A0A8X6Q7N3_NEPPI|nr:hypothetical protein NPIL_76611 [Nephila pilipes]